jgi:hypothetical protein
MVLISDYPVMEDSEALKFQAVDEKVIKFLVSKIEEADFESLIDWNKFRDYCIEFGMDEAPNILTIPISVLDRCIAEAKRTAHYRDNLNRLL